MSESKSKKNVCPECQENDCVRKVSAIFENETTYGTTATKGMSTGLALVGGHLATGVSSSIGTSTHVFQSSLSQKLAPPERPNLLEIHNQYLALIAGFIGCFLGACITRGSTGVQFALIIAGTAFLVFAALIRGGLAEAKIQDENNLATWKKIMSSWSEFFYCARCDGVFRPGDEHLRPCDAVRSGNSE